jgi:hypothetical protein
MTVPTNKKEKVKIAENIPQELALIIYLWDKLPETIHSAIAAIVKISIK